MTRHRPSAAPAGQSRDRETVPSGDALGVRLAYDPPRLSLLGDLRDLTLGGSIGRGDSGAPTEQSVLGGI
jgi:hypothetical protein